MRRNLALDVCVLCLAATTALRAEAVRAPSVERQVVLLYDSSQASRELVAEAEEEASRIFGAAGIALEWQSCPQTGYECVEADERPVIIRLVTSANAFLPKATLAYASADARNSGTWAFVYVDRIEEFAAEMRPPSGVARMLGLVIAHEMGHLLLPLVGHTEDGIMTAEWRRKQLAEAAAGDLLFTPLEAARMRTQVRERAARTLAASP